MSLPFISHKDKQLIFSFLAVFTNKTGCQCQNLLPSAPAERHLHPPPLFLFLHSKSKHSSFLTREDAGQMPADYTCNLFSWGLGFSFRGHASARGDARPQEFQQPEAEASWLQLGHSWGHPMQGQGLDFHDPCGSCPAQDILILWAGTVGVTTISSISQHSHITCLFKIIIEISVLPTNSWWIRSKESGLVCAYP